MFLGAHALEVEEDGLLAPEAAVLLAPVCWAPELVPEVVAAVFVAGELEVVPEEEPPDWEAVQLTAVGTETPWAAQMVEAKATAEDWSLVLQPPGLARQQAMSPRKLWLEQMHFASVPQLPMPPEKNWLAQSCCGMEKGQRSASVPQTAGLRSQVGQEMQFGRMGISSRMTAQTHSTLRQALELRGGKAGKGERRENSDGLHLWVI